MTIKDFDKVVTINNPEERLEVLRWIISHHNYVTVKDPNQYIVDAVTTQAILSVYDNLNKEHQKHYLSKTIRVMADVAWKLLTKK
jgi:trans-aconitate methyltransferase